MPAQPAWFHRLPEILNDLRALPVSHLDRRAVQKLFGVGERRARQIMAGLPGLRAGNAAAVERLALLERLEHTAAGARFQWEVARRARLEENLDRIRRESAGRRVRIPAVDNNSVGELGAGIELHPGELRIRFSGAEDLAARLFEISRAMVNNWPAFTRKVEDRLPLPRAR